MSYHKVAKFWLVCALLLAGVWAVLWTMSDAKAQLKMRQKSTVHITNPLPQHIDHLNDFEGLLSVVGQEALSQDGRHYTAQFKDKKFLQKNKDKWTVQVMDVAEYKLIVDYLDTRSDKDKFAYFRYLDTDAKERYVLTYEVMPTFQQALGAAKLIDFHLPSSNRVLPEQFLRYLQNVDTYELQAEAVAESLEHIVKRNTPKVVNEAISDAPPIMGSPESELKKNDVAEEIVSINDKPINEQPNNDKPANEKLPEVRQKQSPIKSTETAAKKSIEIPPTIKPTEKAKPLAVIDALPPSLENQ